jgi:hypothetical protein
MHAPFAFSRNDREEVIRPTSGLAVTACVRGVNLSTAGSINNGSRLKACA